VEQQDRRTAAGGDDVQSHVGEGHVMVFDAVEVDAPCVCCQAAILLRP
jgi:hypothetical protein